MATPLTVALALSLAGGAAARPRHFARGNTTTAPDGAGTVTCHYDGGWVVPVQIGNPGQTVYLNVDTGSSDL